jgi:hypothetical protein
MIVDIHWSMFLMVHTFSEGDAEDPSSSWVVVEACHWIHRFKSPIQLDSTEVRLGLKKESSHMRYFIRSNGIVLTIEWGSGHKFINGRIFFGK